MGTYNDPVTMRFGRVEDGLRVPGSEREKRMDLKAKLADLHNYLMQNGTILDHAECTIGVHKDAITKYKIDGETICVSTHDGVVSSVIYR